MVGDTGTERQEMPDRGAGRLRLDRSLLPALLPRSEFEVASRLRQADARLLVTAYLKGRLGTSFDWDAVPEARDRLRAERLLTGRGGHPQATRLGNAVARALATGYLPVEDMPHPRHSAALLRIYRERVYRIKHRGRTVTSNCRPSRKSGDRTIRLEFVELQDFDLPEAAGSEERYVYQDSKGTRLLRERLDGALSLFANMPSRILHPLLYDSRQDEVVAAAFVDGETIYVRLDARYANYVRARYGETRISANLAELRNAREEGGPVAVAFSTAEHLDALLFGHARLATETGKIEGALASAYEVGPAGD